MTTAVPELLQQLADAVGVATAARSLAAHRRAAQRRLLPAYHVTRTGDPAASVVPAMGPDEAWLTLEDGGETDLEVVDGQVQLPADLPWGYHTLHGRAGARPRPS